MPTFRSIIFVRFLALGGREDGERVQVIVGAAAGRMNGTWFRGLGVAGCEDRGGEKGEDWGEVDELHVGELVALD